MKLRNYRKLPHWALHTYCGKCRCKSMYIRANAAASDMGTINSSDRITATLYSLRALFVSGIYVLIPCIKEIVSIIIIIINT
jgi:hypothetical protein